MYECGSPGPLPFDRRDTLGNYDTTHVYAVDSGDDYIVGGNREGARYVNESFKITERLRTAN
jgi:hypothetical protein